MRCSEVYVDTDESALVLSAKVFVSRKEHKCYECSRTINVKEQYLIEKVLWEGAVSTIKTCLDCKSIRDNFFTAGWYWGYTIDLLRDHLNQTDGDVSESCLAQLSPGARNNVCDMIQRVWGPE